MCEICSKITITTLERRRRRFGVFIVTLEQISQCSGVPIIDFEHVLFSKRPEKQNSSCEELELHNRLIPPAITCSKLAIETLEQTLNIFSHLQ